MRLLLLVLALYVATTGCANDAGGGGASSDDKPADVEQRTTRWVQDAVPLALEAVSGTKAEIRAQWRSCMPGLSYRYEGDGLLDAPAARDAAGIEDVRAALVEAGYAEVSEVEGHVTVARDGVTLDVRAPSPAYGPGRWRVSFHTECFSYSGDDKAAVESDEGRMLEGLAP